MENSSLSQTEWIGHRSWRYYETLPNVPSPLLYRNVLYLVEDGVIITALDAQSGEVLKQGRLRNALEKYFSAPVAADGKVYMMSQAGLGSDSGE